MKKLNLKYESSIFWICAVAFVLLSFSMFIIQHTFTEFSWTFSIKYCNLLKSAVFFYPFSIISALILRGENFFLLRTILSSFLGLIFYFSVAYLYYKNTMNTKEKKKKIFKYLLLIILIFVVLALFGNLVCNL